MSKSQSVWIIGLCLGLALLAGPAMATEAAPEVSADQQQACSSVIEPVLNLSVFQDGDVVIEPCDPDDEACASSNVWCCKPNDAGTDQQCKKIKRSKCLANPAGTVHPSQNACTRAC